MSLRVSILGVVWFLVAILVIFSPNQQSQDLFLGSIPIRSIVHLILYWGLVHIWVCALKKQLKFSKLKKNAFILVGIFTLSLAVFSEAISYVYHLNVFFSLWNFLFDILGVLVGMLTFRLLYSSCY